MRYNDRKEIRELIQEALSSYSDELGLEYSSIREEFDDGEIFSKFLPKTQTDTETITKCSSAVYDPYLRTWTRYGQEKKEPTLLGKVNALAEYLGVDFEITPEKVTAEEVKVVKKGKK